MGNIHNFQRSLAYSHAASDNPVWSKVYLKAFPTMLTMTDLRKNGPHQMQGIDRSITLSNAKQITVDEKVRKKDYGDILLEYISNDKKMSPGWVEKPLVCDYIAYLIAPTQKCYLLPFLELQRAWFQNKKKWIEYYSIPPAQNDGYNTISVALPIIEELFPAMNGAMIIDAKKPEKQA